MKAVGGGDDPKAPPLSPQQMSDWNRYVDWLEKKGYKGSKELDKKETGLARKLLEDFRKETPDVTITYEDVPKVQSEMQKLADAARSFETRRGNPNASKIMSGVSKLDGWPGSRTTAFRFPDMMQQQFQNGALVEQKELGLVNSALKPTGVLQVMKDNPNRAVVPGGKQLEKMGDGNWYYTNAQGDLVRYVGN